ncbi:DUF2721 domain-containing protein [Leptospira venezuelensis]|uniref:DUF2721 domain-containing protein n=1 Tax=Leptospira venezuelensis TaxID=1958811 RepID=UPI000A3959C6|nr:DUF2721 domain-containing protein [Leptospira venezuelensis]
MEVLTYNTPGILFPAISLLMLAFTNRFFGLTSLVRQLLDKYREHQDSALIAQIQNLKIRISQIRSAQAFGILSLTFCTISISLVAIWNMGAWYFFGFSLVSMLISLMYSLIEIQLSVKALEIEIETTIRSTKN